MLCNSTNFEVIKCLFSLFISDQLVVTQAAFPSILGFLELLIPELGSSTGFMDRV